MLTNEPIPYERALELVLEHANVLEAVEVDLLDAVGRAAACDLASDIDVAPFDHSAMDGFALRAAQLEGASPDSPVVLDVVAEIPAGSFYDGNAGPGQCARIMCGAAVPSWADAVVNYERTTAVSGNARLGGSVAFTAPVEAGTYVRRAGMLAKQGQVIVPKGAVVQSAGVGFLADCGITRVPVIRHPRVAVVCIGSELVDADGFPPRGKIRGSNGYGLAARVRRAGATAQMLPIVPDDPALISRAVQEAAASTDAVVTTGGSAGGDFDFIKQAIADAGNALFSNVNIRPGQSITFGLVGETPVFGLSGSPAAAFMAFEMLVRPLLRKMAGHERFVRPRVHARLSSDERKSGDYRLFRRAYLAEGKDGELVAVTTHDAREGLFDAAIRPNCFAVFPEGERCFHAGDQVECVLIDLPEEMQLR